METDRALSALAALGQSGRLAAFRRLVKAAPDGMLAGALAADLGVRDNTLSASLAVLHSAGLVTRQREGRAVRYGADLAGLGALIDFLVEDCCSGQRLPCTTTMRSVTACDHGC